MKKALALIITSLLALSLISCGASFDADEENRFICISEESVNTSTYLYSYVLKDTKTGVLYLFARTGNGTGLSVMYDADGSVLTDKE